MIVNSVQEAFSHCEKDLEVMICGGAQIYAATLPLADKLYISEVEGQWSGDVLFPQVNWGDWELQNEEKKQGFVFKIWKRRVI